jgi:transposase-like protein
MKRVLNVHDVVALAKCFETSSALALREVGDAVRQGAREVLERVMEAEIELSFGRHAEADIKHNGDSSWTFALKSVGALERRVPRGRAGRFASHVVPKGRRYDEALPCLGFNLLETRKISQLPQELHPSEGIVPC